MFLSMDSYQRTHDQADWAYLKSALLNYHTLTPPAETQPVGLFADILTKLTRSKTGSNWRAISYLWDKYEGGLKHARQGKLSSAEQVFAEVSVARQPFAEISWLNQLIDVAALPAVAYLYYKLEQYTNAENLLIASIDSDAELLPEGIYILEFHRVQQLHNLARLYFRQGWLEQGARTINMALSFLVYGQTPAIGNGKGWQKKAHEPIPHQLRSDMLWQLTSESVGLFLAHPAQSVELCQTAFGNMTFWEAQTPDEAGMLNWFTLTESRYDGHWQGNMQQATNFLTTSPSSFDQLKLALVLDMVAVGRQYPANVVVLQEETLHFIGRLQIGKAQRETCSLFVHQLLQTGL